MQPQFAFLFLYKSKLRILSYPAGLHKGGEQPEKDAGSLVSALQDLSLSSPFQ